MDVLVQRGKITKSSHSISLLVVPVPGYNQVGVLLSFAEQFNHGISPLIGIADENDGLRFSEWFCPCVLNGFVPKVLKHFNLYSIRL